MTVRGLFERKSEQQILTQLKEKVPVAATAAWQFWPFANMIAFGLVPVMYRVLYGNVCAIFWNAKLSHISTQTSVGATVPSVRKELEASSSICSSRFDEILPTCGFDEAWVLGSAAGSPDMHRTGFDEVLPTC